MKFDQKSICINNDDNEIRLKHYVCDKIKSMDIHSMFNKQGEFYDKEYERYLTQYKN